MQSKRSHYPTYKKAKTVLKFHYGPFVKLYIVPCPLAPVGIVRCRSCSDQLHLTIWDDFTVYILVNTVIPLTLWTFLSLDSADSSVMSFEPRLSIMVMSLVRFGQFDADVIVCFQSKCELNDEIKKCTHKSGQNGHPGSNLSEAGAASYASLRQEMTLKGIYC